MSEPRFVLYYWPIPFRAQLARYILAYAGEAWEEPDREAVFAARSADVSEQPVPFMAPPLLEDRKEGVWLSQLPAITSYLGDVLGLMPGTPAQDARTVKVINDCVDVLHDLTRNCGMQMWDEESWAAFADERLPRWLAIFDELGRRAGLDAETGTLLGTPRPGVADLVCAALWVTITDTLPKLEQVISEHAPNVYALSLRISETPAIATLRAEQKARWGDVWCEGQIEKSLRSVLAKWRP